MVPTKVSPGSPPKYFFGNKQYDAMCPFSLSLSLSLFWWFLKIMFTCHNMAS
jgi:hypothetical protein